VSAPTRCSSASTFICGFITLIAAAAFCALDDWMSHERKRNWRLRFDFSIVSGSVSTTPPFAPVPTPIIAQFLSISHPMAPEPTSR
jgi:hypothetical protein